MKSRLYQRAPFSNRKVGNLISLGHLSRLPPLIARIELREDKDKLVENTHRKRARTTSWVENLQMVNRVDERINLVTCELMGLVAVRHELAYALFHLSGFWESILQICA